MNRCPNKAFVVPRHVGLTIDLQRNWNELKRYEQQCSLPKDHPGDHVYEEAKGER